MPWNRLPLTIDKAIGDRGGQLIENSVCQQFLLETIFFVLLQYLLGQRDVSLYQSVAETFSKTFNLLTLVKAKLIKPHATLLSRQQTVCTAGKKLPFIQRSHGSP